MNKQEMRGENRTGYQRDLLFDRRWNLCWKSWAAGDAERGPPSPAADDARRLRRGEDDGVAQRQDPLPLANSERDGRRLTLAGISAIKREMTDETAEGPQGWRPPVACPQPRLTAEWNVRY